MEDKNFTRNHILWALVAGVLIGLVGYYLVDTRGVWIKFTSQKTENVIQETDSSPDVESIKNIGSISALDQLAGLTAHIKRAALSNDGWIVIHETLNGKPGNVLGARRLDAGTYEDIEVELLRNTVEDATYVAMLHQDDGDRSFDLTKDFPSKNNDGESVMASFQAIHR